jgi:hypothetical protein
MTTTPQVDTIKAKRTGVDHDVIRTLAELNRLRQSGAAEPAGTEQPVEAPAAARDRAGSSTTSSSTRRKGFGLGLLKRRSKQQEEVKGLADWSVDDVLQWLTSIDMDFYGPVLEASGVDGQKLKNIKGESGFERLGIANYRDALMLWHSLQTLRESEATTSVAAEQVEGGAGSSSGSGAGPGSDASDAASGVAAWTLLDIRKWLAGCEQSHWETTLTTAGVTGSVLAGISNNVAFEKLGITNPRDCMALYRALQTAKREAAKTVSAGKKQASSIEDGAHMPPPPQTSSASDSPHMPTKTNNYEQGGSTTTASAVPSLLVPHMSDLGVHVTRVHEPVALPVSVSYVPTDASEAAASHSGSVGLDMTDTTQRAMLARSKKMLIDLLRQLPERTSLHDVIFTPPPLQAEQSHKAFVARVSMSEGLTERVRSRAVSVVGATLKQLQALVQANLKKLVQAGVVAEEDDYQALKNALALDIRHHALLRRDRRNEQRRLSATRAQLDGKTHALRDRIKVYEQYTERIMNPAAASVVPKPGAASPRTGGGAGTTAAPPRRLGSKKPTLAGADTSLGGTSNGGAGAAANISISADGKDAIGGSGRFGTHKWTATKLKQRRALVSVAILPSVLPMKDIVVEVASYSAGEYRFSAMITRGEFERATWTADQLKAKAGTATGGAEIVPGLTFNLSALFLLLAKKF